MAEQERAAVVRLGDAELTVRDPKEDIRGREVEDATGEKIGTVHGLMIDEDDVKIRFLEVAAGGFLGIGERTFLIPVDAVKSIDEQTVHIDRSRDHIVNSPPYEPELAPAPDYYEALYGHYGYAPYWGPGYMYPAGIGFYA